MKIEKITKTQFDLTFLYSGVGKDLESFVSIAQDLRQKLSIPSDPKRIKSLEADTIKYLRARYCDTLERLCVENYDQLIEAKNDASSLDVVRVVLPVTIDFQFAGHLVLIIPTTPDERFNSYVATEATIDYGFDTTINLFAPMRLNMFIGRDSLVVNGRVR